jgi:hypothetical protein
VKVLPIPRAHPDLKEDVVEFADALGQEIGEGSNVYVLSYMDGVRIQGVNRTVLLKNDGTWRMEK